MSRGMIMTRLGLPIAALAAISVQTAPASAQSSASPFTYATRYDAAGRVTGTIAPDPDGAGAIKYAATRTTYDAAGRPAKIETGELASWQSESIAPASWSGFTRLSVVDTVYACRDISEGSRLRKWGVRRVK